MSSLPTESKKPKKVAPRFLAWKTFIALALVSLLVGVTGGQLLIQEIRSAYLKSLAEASQRQAEQIAAWFESEMAAMNSDVVLADFQQMLAGLPIDETGFVCLLDSDATVLAHPDPSIIGTSLAKAPVRPLDDPATTVLEDSIQSDGTREFLLSEKSEAEPMQLVFQESVPGRDWIVSVHSDLAAVETRISGIARKLAWIVGVLLLSLTALGTAAVRLVARRYERQLLQANRELDERVHRRTAQLQQAKEEAESADRLKAEFLSTMNHEYRTPLNAVLGMSQLLQSSNLDDEQSEWVAEICTSGERLLDLLEKILFFAEIESGMIHPEDSPFNVADLIDSVAQRTGSLAEAKGLDFSVEKKNLGDFQMHGDRQWIERALQQLTDNAVKYTDAGRITLRASLKDPTRESVPHPPDTETVKLVVQVEDTGEGIAPAIQGELFGLFRQGDGSNTRKHEGVGIGLIMAQRLLERVGGAIHFASTPGQGSTFHVEIPSSCGILR